VAPFGHAALQAGKPYGIFAHGALTLGLNTAITLRQQPEIATLLALADMQFLAAMQQLSSFTTEV